MDGVAVGKKWRSECMCSSTVLTCVDPATGYGLLETSLPYAHTHTYNVFVYMSQKKRFNAQLRCRATYFGSSEKKCLRDFRQVMSPNEA